MSGQVQELQVPGTPEGGTRVENNRRPRLRGVLRLPAEARRAEAVEIWSLGSGRAALFLRACGAMMSAGLFPAVAGILACENRGAFNK